MFILDNITIRGRYYPQYSRKNVDNWRGLWESQRIGAIFGVIFCKAPTDFMNINDRGVPKGDFNFAKKRAERRA